MSAQRAKGTRYETELCDEFTSQGHPASRTGSANYGGGDLDVPSLPDMVFEAKNHKSIDLASFVDQAVTAGKRLNKLPVLFIKRRNRHARESYVVLPAWAFFDLLRRRPH